MFGINEKGLAVGMTYVWAKKLKAGINSMFLVRYILEKCATVEEGLKAIGNIPIGGAYHLVLADNNEFVHAECSPLEIKINRGNFAVASNHFVSEEMKKHPIELFIEKADKAINQEDFDTLIDIYADDAVLVIKPVMNAVGNG